MNREEFMSQLERLLVEIPLNDRQDAIAYYNDYFEEAGPLNEACVIQKLGSPGKVAATIKADLKENSFSQGEYTEKGYEDPRYQEEFNVPMDRKERGYHAPKQKNRLPIALLIVIILLTTPIWMGLLSGILGLLLGIAATIVGILIAAGIGGIAFCFSGIVMVIVGMIKIFAVPMLGTLMLGIGFLFLSLGILAVFIFIFVTFKLLPKLFRWFVDTCQRILKKGEGRSV